MAISEAARADLYTGLAEVLGPERAETLMAYLPTFDPTDVATKADITQLRDEMNQRFQQVDQRFQQVDQRFLELNGRLDRLFHTLLAGMFVVIAAMIGLAVLAA